jgi:hypothetical protein
MIPVPDPVSLSKPEIYDVTDGVGLWNGKRKILCAKFIIGF